MKIIKTFIGSCSSCPHGGDCVDPENVICALLTSEASRRHDWGYPLVNLIKQQFHDDCPLDDYKDQ